jgi:hypothetical protein
MAALYAAVPTTLPFPKGVRKITDAELCARIPGLRQFLSLVAFADSMVQAAPAAMAQAVVAGVETALLNPILLPALHQRRAADAAAATAYYHAMLRRAQQPMFLRVLLKLLLRGQQDGQRTVDVLILRLDGLGDLGYLTMSLFHHLLGLYCEDVILVLCLRHLARAQSGAGSRNGGGERKSAAEEAQAWKRWGLEMQSCDWLLRLRPGLAAESPSHRTFTDYIFDARHACAVGRGACQGVWTRDYWLVEAGGVGEAEGESEGVSAEEGLFLSKLTCMLERMPQSSAMVRWWRNRGGGVRINSPLMQQPPSADQPHGDGHGAEAGVLSAAAHPRLGFRRPLWRQLHRCRQHCHLHLQPHHRQHHQLRLCPLPAVCVPISCRGRAGEGDGHHPQPGAGAGRLPQRRRGLL